MPPLPTPSPARPAPSRFERLCRSYEAEMYPLADERLNQPLLAALAQAPVSSHERVLDFGAGAGHVAAAISLHGPAQLVAAEPSRSMLGLLCQSTATRATAVHVVRAGMPASADDLPFATGAFHRVFAHARADGGVNVSAHARELVRVCREGGRIDVSLATDATWREPLDLLDEALQRRSDRPARSALAAYRQQFPGADKVASTLEGLGLRNVEVKAEQAQILFRSGREFFFSPLIELGPLRQWKSLVGKGEALQAAFASVKQAIDTYYIGRPFAVTVGITSATGIKINKLP